MWFPVVQPTPVLWTPQLFPTALSFPCLYCLVGVISFKRQLIYLVDKHDFCFPWPKENVQHRRMANSYRKRIQRLVPRDKYSWSKKLLQQGPKPHGNSRLTSAFWISGNSSQNQGGKEALNTERSPCIWSNSQWMSTPYLSFPVCRENPRILYFLWLHQVVITSG